jgi:DNA-binding transcriptional ArsR family regulator
MPQTFGPSQELIAKTVERLRAIGDEARIRILIRLRGSECNVNTLVRDLGIAQASVSKHLSVLRQAGIVTFRRDGAQSLYTIKDDSVFDVCTLICGSIKRHQSQLSEAIENSDFEI